MIFEVKAPSNIALIKYMGKKDSLQNFPENASLSLTLSDLCTTTCVELLESKNAPIEFLVETQTSEKLRLHLERIKAWARKEFPKFGLKSRSAGAIKIRSTNNFPEGAGIASSASSYASMTLAGLCALSANVADAKKLFETNSSFKTSVSLLAGQGSGSASRSLMGPYVYWDGQEVISLSPPSWPRLADLVIVVNAEKKLVSSSEAHARVKTSSLWPTRKERVRRRMEELKILLKESHWENVRGPVSHLLWNEFWDMHHLFETSTPPFQYMHQKTISILQWLNEKMLHSTEPPWVTLDAGPNPHVIVPEKEAEAWRTEIQNQFPEFKILRDSQGEGAKIHL